MTIQPYKFLKELFCTAVDAAHPSQCINNNLPEPPIGRTVIVGAGKAAADASECLSAPFSCGLDALEGFVDFIGQLGDLPALFDDAAEGLAELNELPSSVKEAIICGILGQLIVESGGLTLLAKTLPKMIPKITPK